MKSSEDTFPGVFPPLAFVLRFIVKATCVVAAWAQDNPLEEFLRGELDSSTPRVFGGFWMVVFEG